MKIKWLGHASFLITSENGTRIITDPYKTGDDIKYNPIEETAEIVTVSHQHFDHGNVPAVKGNPRVVRKTDEAKGIKFKGIPTAHDEAGGSKRGGNIIFCFEIDSINVCHAGDLGHLLNNKQVTEIGKIDVLLVPVGGFFTIDARAAGQVCDQLKPRVIIPMHYKTDKLDLPVTGVDEFLRGKNNVTRLDSSEVELKSGNLPVGPQIVVLKSAK